MDTAQSQFTRLQRIKDTANFNVDDLHHYNLLLLIGNGDFQLCVTDPRNNRCLLVEDFQLAEAPMTDHDRLEALKVLFDGHHILTAGFWNHVKLAFKHQKFTLVPSALFIKEELAAYLALNCEPDLDAEYLHYYKHSQSDAVNVFTANQAIINWLTSIYSASKLQLLHQGSSFIEGVLQNDDHQPFRTMFLLVEANTLHVLVSQDKKLEFYNRFSIKKHDDYLKYISMVMKNLKLKADQTKVLIWGKLQNDATLFKELHQHIQHLSFGNKPAYLQFNYMFDDVPEQYYFDLFSMHLCD